MKSMNIAMTKVVRLRGHLYAVWYKPCLTVMKPDISTPPM
jgi:hypothetical protein